MVADVWSVCEGDKQVVPINTVAWRIVEAQEVAATRKLVDSMEEQMILEDMLDSSKPVLLLDSKYYHPLLSTPFRYPPLKHGSRFGSKFEPALWYGSLSMNGAMAEKAFYQFNFLRASEANYGIVQIPLTMFSVQINTDSGIALNKMPFQRFQQEISSPNSYLASQRLGAAMRTALVQAFTYHSARTVEDEINIGLFTVNAFRQKLPDVQSFQSWQCIATNDVIEFVRTSSLIAETIPYSINQFLLNGELPFPAS